MIADVNRYLVGWHWYFKAVWSAYPATPFGSFDGFVRRRLRAALVGKPGQGWWDVKIPNKLLRQLGLLSLDELNRQYRGGLLQAPTRQGGPGGEPYAGKPHVRFGKAGGWATTP